MTSRTDDYFPSKDPGSTTRNRIPLLSSPLDRPRFKLPDLKVGNKIGFVGSVSLLVSSITGPGLVLVTTLFQQAGLVLPTLAFLLIGLMTSLTSLFLAEAIANFPRNERLERDVELSTLVRHFFGRRWEAVMQVVLYLSMQSLNIASIIISSQTLDQFLVSLAGQTCGLALSSPGPGWVCVNTVSQSNSPFENTYMLFTSGYLILIGMIIPLAMLRLADNIIVQLLSMVTLKFIVLTWIVSFSMKGLNPSLVPLFGDNYSGVASTLVVNFAYLTTLPSWIGEKHKDVSVPKTIYTSVGISTFIYISLGIIGGMSVKMEHNSNILSTISGDPTSSVLMRVTTFIFPIVVLVTSIPIYCIVIRYNLRQSGLFGPWGALGMAVIVPFVFVIPFQTGSYLNSFLNWTSLIFTSVANFWAPLLIYICLPYTKAYIQRSDFVALPYMHNVPALEDETQHQHHHFIRNSPATIEPLPSDSPALIPAITLSTPTQEDSTKSPSSFWLSSALPPRLVLTRETGDEVDLSEAKHLDNDGMSYKTSKMSPRSGFLSLSSRQSASDGDYIDGGGGGLTPPPRPRSGSVGSIHAGSLRGSPHAATVLGTYSPVERRPSIEMEAFEFEKGVLSYPYLSMPRISLGRRSSYNSEIMINGSGVHGTDGTGETFNDGMMIMDEDEDEAAIRPVEDESVPEVFSALPTAFRGWSKWISRSSLVVAVALVVGTILYDIIETTLGIDVF
ncbi:hypothetical protein SmJEL517_g00004 [Synchytrium microbalum]|uniref:Amino acid transporter transmembrane domain-containing protein n=1 Tax=Synchytrium microbalum TaxID=1806994 RepID=A0A507CFQ4_9FUNG|nr:uncharacterized protein SmJEL517_g00004 [Synchytrium microbalum]TPX38009.1 hypothetical protein SmJEL517_g00004 [Synchytrium microbalum]